MSDIQVWERVGDDLRQVIGELSASAQADAAPLHYRLAVIQLECALLEDAEKLLEGRDDEASLEDLRAALHAQLTGETPSIGVLEALAPGVRSTAMTALREGLTANLDHAPALWAASALAQVSGRWNEAIEWLKRLSEHAGVASGGVLATLGDIYWQKLGKPAEARAWYKAARKELGSDAVLLDKLLKLYLELEEWEPAIRTCYTLIDQVTAEKRSEMAVTYQLTLGEIHVYGLREPGAALVHYLRAVTAIPHYPLTYTLMQELFEGNEWPAFEAHFEAMEAAELAPLQDALDHVRAAVQEGKGNSAATITALKKRVGAP